MVGAVKLGVVDQCLVPQGASASDAVASTLALAQAAETLGYGRYWLAEHHNTPSLAGTSPEVLVGAVAACTSSMRVGSGGVLLSHYSPLKVAENFQLLEALHPGRIDLGLGRAAGGDPVAEAALQYRPGALGDEYFAEKVVDLLGFLDGNLDSDHPYAGVRAMPVNHRARAGTGPDVWVLGSSSQGAGCAAYLGLPFAFAQFITADFGPQVVASYRKGFRSSGRRTEAQALVAVPVICAPSDAEADHLARSGDLWLLRPEGGERGPLLSPDEAAAVPLSALQRARLAQNRAKTVVGSPATVAARLEEMAATFRVDELLMLTVCHDPAARIRSYQLVAEALGIYAPEP